MRKQQMLQLEKQMQDVEKQQKMLTAMASKQRQELMEKIRKVRPSILDNVASIEGIALMQALSW